MSKHNIFEVKDRDTISDPLTEMLRTGSQQLIYQAVQIELEAVPTKNPARVDFLDFSDCGRVAFPV
jgi:hypothetical protein